MLFPEEDAPQLKAWIVKRIENTFVQPPTPSPPDVSPVRAACACLPVYVFANHLPLYQIRRRF